MAVEGAGGSQAGLVCTLSTCAQPPAPSSHWDGMTRKDISKVESARLSVGVEGYGCVWIVPGPQCLAQSGHTVGVQERPTD